MKYIKTFNTRSQYNEFKNGAEFALPNVSAIRTEFPSQDSVEFNPYDSILTFTALETNSSIQLAIEGSPNPISLQYSIDNGSTWNTYTIGNNITLANIGDNVKFKGINSTFSGLKGSYYKFVMTGKIRANGDITSLLNGVGGDYALSDNCFHGIFTNCSSLVSAPALPATTLAYYCYSSMFSGCTSLTSAPALPAITLAEGCYSSMFSDCTSLISAPTLPATTLVQSCYSSMFYGCTSLTNAPALPAITLAQSCYSSMFYGCTSLTSAPALPATTLAQSCYANMFNCCTSLTSAPALPATILAYNCYSYMFQYCTSLTSAPVLPAITLVDYCYSWMFNGCTALISAPALPATTMTIGCYYYMFSGCTSLTSAPVLPATSSVPYCYSYMFYGCTSLTSAPALPIATLADHCYESMFSGCTSLTSAPALLATSLAKYCYMQMFYGCTSLNSITCLATDISATYCLKNWVSNVAATGTFIKAPSNENWNRGTSGIPNGWTIESYVKHDLIIWIDDYRPKEEDDTDGYMCGDPIEDIIGHALANTYNTHDYNGANPYRYTETSIEYGNVEYYLWEAVEGYGNDNENSKYLATTTIDFDTLYSQSLEDSYEAGDLQATLSNHFTSAIGVFSDDQQMYCQQIIGIDNTIYDEYCLLKVEQI